MGEYDGGFDVRVLVVVALALLVEGVGDEGDFFGCSPVLDLF